MSLIASCIEQTRKGRTYEEIAAMIGTSLDCVRSLVSKARRDGRLPAKQSLWPQIQAHHLAGMSQRQIASELGIARQTVAKLINKAISEGQLQPVQAQRESRAAEREEARRQRQQERQARRIEREQEKQRRRQEREAKCVQRQKKPAKLPEVKTQPAPTRVRTTWNAGTSCTPLRVVRQERPKVEMTDVLETEVLRLYNQEHYNAQAIAEETGADIADIMEVIRSDRISMLTS